MPSVQIDWGKLMEQGKCLYIGVPFTDEQQKELLKTPKQQRNDLILKWRTEYAEKNESDIVTKALMLDKDTPEDIKELRAKYKEKVGKNVPVAKINDIEFMKNAINK